MTALQHGTSGKLLNNGAGALASGCCCGSSFSPPSPCIGLPGTAIGPAGQSCTAEFTAGGLIGYQVGDTNATSGGGLSDPPPFSQEIDVAGGFGPVSASVRLVAVCEGPVLNPDNITYSSGPYSYTVTAYWAANTGPWSADYPQDYNTGTAVVATGTATFEQFEYAPGFYMAQTYFTLPIDVVISLSHAVRDRLDIPLVNDTKSADTITPALLPVQKGAEIGFTSWPPDATAQNTFARITVNGATFEQIGYPADVDVNTWLCYRMDTATAEVNPWNPNNGSNAQYYSGSDLHINGFAVNGQNLGIATGSAQTIDTYSGSTITYNWNDTSVSVSASAPVNDPAITSSYGKLVIQGAPPWNIPCNVWVKDGAGNPFTAFPLNVVYSTTDPTFSGLSVPLDSNGEANQTIAISCYQVTAGPNVAGTLSDYVSFGAMVTEASATAAYLQKNAGEPLICWLDGLLDNWGSWDAVRLTHVPSLIWDSGIPAAWTPASCTVAASGGYLTAVASATGATIIRDLDAKTLATSAARYWRFRAYASQSGCDLTLTIAGKTWTITNVATTPTDYTIDLCAPNGVSGSDSAMQARFNAEWQQIQGGWGNGISNAPDRSLNEPPFPLLVPEGSDGNYFSADGFNWKGAWTPTFQIAMAFTGASATFYFQNFEMLSAGDLWISVADMESDYDTSGDTGFVSGAWALGPNGPVTTVWGRRGITVNQGSLILDEMAGWGDIDSGNLSGSQARNARSYCMHQVLYFDNWRQSCDGAFGFPARGLTSLSSLAAQIAPTTGDGTNWVSFQESAGAHVQYATWLQYQTDAQMVNCLRPLITKVSGGQNLNLVLYAALRASSVALHPGRAGTINCGRWLGGLISGVVCTPNVGGVAGKVVTAVGNGQTINATTDANGFFIMPTGTVGGSYTVTQGTSSGTVAHGDVWQRCSLEAN